MKCKNCTNSIVNYTKFCANCGARIIGNRLTFKFFFQEFLAKVLSIDNKLLKTFWHLIVKPDYVIKSYIDGVRKKYIEPFSYLLISITLSGITIFLMRENAVDVLDELNQGQNEKFREAYKSIMNTMYDFNSIVTALTIPFYALISWLVFLNKKMFNYVEHLIVYIYTTAQFSILSAILFVGIYFSGLEDSSGTVMMGVLLTSMIYNAYTLKRIFKLNIKQLLIKIIYFLFVLLVLYIFATILVVIAFLIFMGPEGLQEFTAPK